MITLFAYHRGSPCETWERNYSVPYPGIRLQEGRLQRQPGEEIEASSANPAYTSFRFRIVDNGVEVIGRVVWVGREVKQADETQALFRFALKPVLRLFKRWPVLLLPPGGVAG